jgi:hypothetical protein
MKNILRVISIVLIAMFIAATCQASGYRGTGHGYSRAFRGGHGGGYYGGGHGHRGYGFYDDAALIAGILVGGSIINNMVNQPSVPPPEETTCTKSTTTTWENGQLVDKTTTENCEGYRNTTEY